MSSVDLFPQPKPILKPYKCLNCKSRFRMKAYSANHEKQASNSLKTLSFLVIVNWLVISYRFEDSLTLLIIIVIASSFIEYELKTVDQKNCQ